VVTGDLTVVEPERSYWSPLFVDEKAFGHATFSQKGATMTRTDAFVRDMCHVLDSQLGLRFGPEHKEKGLLGCVDAVGTNKGKTRVLIEVELRRYGPERNVIKIWKRLTERKCPDDVIFIHAFSAFYKRKARAKEYAQFIGEKMVKEFSRIQYRQFSFDYNPAARKFTAPVMKGAGRRKHHAEELANIVLAYLREQTQQKTAGAGR
jgi:hypothetical protein